MSIRVMSIVWDRYQGGGSKLLTMLALADFGNDEGKRIYPSIETLAGKVRMSPRQMNRIINELKSEGVIAIINDGNKGGPGQSNQYAIDLGTLSKCHSYREQTLTNCPITLTPEVNNSDIAMSDKPLEPLGTVYPDKSCDAVEWGPPKESQIITLKSYIRQLEKMSDQIRPPDELERARAQLNEIMLQAGEL